MSYCWPRNSYSPTGVMPSFRTWASNERRLFLEISAMPRSSYIPLQVALAVITIQPFRFITRYRSVR